MATNDKVFKNDLNYKKFQYTNKIWNDMKINSPWSVGNVTNLITSHTFRNKEEWKEFYFKSGQDRLNELNKISECNKSKLNLVQMDENLSYEIKNINFRFGRTRDELVHKGHLLYEGVLRDGNKVGLSLRECIYSVMFRTIGETWNGIIQREINTGKVLAKSLNNENIIIKKVDGDFDAKYAVDFEVYLKNKLVCAIQVKPPSYLSGTTPALQEVKSINKEKNNSYTNNYGSNVHYIYSKINGYIENVTVIDEILLDIKKIQVNK